MSRVEHLGEGVTLLQGDCRDFAEAFSGCAAILTDPPFGIGYRSGHATPDLWAGDHIRGDHDVSLRDEALQAMPRVPTLVFGSDRAPRPKGVRMRLIWDKGPALGMGALDLPWKPSTEEIYVIGHGFVGRRDEGAVIYCPPVQSMACNGRLHPNEKPIALLQRLMAKLPDDCIGDPFMGSGSTGVAAVREGRSFVGCEIEPRYFETALRRIAAELARPRLPLPEPVAKAVQTDMLDYSAAQHQPLFEVGS